MNACDLELIKAVNLLCDFAAANMPDGYRLELRCEDGEASLTVYDQGDEDIRYEADGSSWRCAIDAARDHSRRCER